MRIPTHPINRPCVPGLSAQPCLNRGLNGLGDFADYPTHPHRRFIVPIRYVLRRTYPPAPLFASLIVGYACAYEERGVKLL